MSTSIYLAKIIGLYLIFSSMALLLYQERFKKLFKDAMGSPFFVSFSGLISFIFGLLIVLSHNHWLRNWTTLVTIIGWLFLFQGFMRVYFPKQAIEWTKNMTQGKGSMLWIGWISLIVGLYLTYMSFAASGMMGKNCY